MRMSESSIGLEGTVRLVRMRLTRLRGRRAMLACSLAVLPAASALGTTLRIASYNIDSSDIGDNTTLGNVATVVQGIGNHHMAGNAQPVDVLGMEELLDTNNNSLTSTSLPALVNDLNALYGPGTYAYDTTPDPTTGGTQFNGPSGLIYNTHTIQVISATALGPIGGSNPPLPPRAPMRYELRPVGYGSNADFYMYVSHYKASTDSISQSRRNAEAMEIRQDADALGANAHIIYSGDFNLSTGSGEAAYQTLLSAGNGQAVDPADLTHTWTANSSTWRYLYSISTTTLNGRLDFQLVSNAVINQPGLQLAPDPADPLGFPSPHYPYSYEVFGNNGTTALNGATNSSGNTSLSDLGTAAASAAKSALAAASDHLPLMADYNLVGVTPLPQNRYYVGPASGLWNTTASWSATHGGSPGASVPANGDIVFIDPSTNATVTFDGNYSSPGIGELRLRASGGATATLSQAANTMAVSATLGIGDIAGTKGTYTLSGGALSATNVVIGASGGGTGSLTWSGGALQAGNVTLIATGQMTVSARGGGGNKVLRVSTLNIDQANGAKLDLNDNDLVVITGVFSTVQNLIVTGYSATPDAGKTGIISTTGQNSSGKTILALFDNALVGLTAWPTGSGQTVSSTAIIGKYTYFGDATLDGQVTADDYLVLDANRNTAPPTGVAWIKGDMTNDGSVTADDYLVLDANRGLGVGSPLGASGFVPEPLGLSVLAVIPFCRRRRRS